MQVSERWSKNIALIKAKFKFARPVWAAWQISFELNLLHQCWSYRISTLLYLGCIRKKYCFLQSAVTPGVTRSNKCSEFNLISFSFSLFFQKTSHFIERILRYENKEVKTLHRQFYRYNWNVLSAFNQCARARLAWKHLTFQNHLNLYEVFT